MCEEDEFRHDSFLVRREGQRVRVETEGHYFELLPEMAIDLAEHLKSLVGEITGHA